MFVPIVISSPDTVRSPVTVKFCDAVTLPLESIAKASVSDVWPMLVPLIIILSTVKVVSVPTDVRLGIAVISSSKYADKSVTATCFIVPPSFSTTLSASATVVEVAVVSPSIIFNSVAVEVTPSSILSSAAVALIAVPL